MKAVIKEALEIVALWLFIFLLAVLASKALI